MVLVLAEGEQQARWQLQTWPASLPAWPSAAAQSLVGGFYMAVEALRSRLIVHSREQEPRTKLALRSCLSASSKAPAACRPHLASSSVRILSSSPCWAVRCGAVLCSVRGGRDGRAEGWTAWAGQLGRRLVTAIAGGMGTCCGNSAKDRPTCICGISRVGLGRGTLQQPLVPESTA